MDRDFAIFLALASAWFVARVALRRWVSQRLAAGTIDSGEAVFLLISSFAVLPLLMIPWRHSDVEIVVLVAASFLILGIGAIVARFAGRSSTP